MRTSHNQPNRRASISSTLSHADSFHSLEFSSHELRDHEQKTSLPLSGAKSNAYAGNLPSSDTQRHGNLSQISSESPCQPFVDNNEGDIPGGVNMERKDSKFTISSASSSTSHRSPRQHVATSPPSSRRTSMTRRHPSCSQSGKRPQLGSRRNTQTQEELYAAHARACALFPNGRRTSRRSSQIYSAPQSQTSLSKYPQAAPLFPIGPYDQEPPTTVQSRATSYAGTTTSTINVSKPAQQSTAKCEPTAAVQSQTVIDWMSPATRRDTYEKYDRDRRGVRGLWRKLTPNCFWRGSRVEFYDNKNDDNDDARSVRRHRQALDDDDNDSDKENINAERPSTKARHKRSWSCFAESKQK